MPTLNSSGDRPRVVILVDNRKRDLLGAALIGVQLRKLGIECFLEPLGSYRGALAAYRPSMIVFNHLTANHLVEYSRRLADLGVLVAVLPNEGILYEEDMLKFNAGKYHNGAHIDCFFCWNEHHRKALVECGFNKSERLEVIGPPRFDFYFEPWSELFRIEKFGDPTKPTVLLCTNFVFARNKFLDRDMVDRNFAPWAQSVLSYRNHWEMIEANYRSSRRFFPFLDEVARSGKFNIILRPHPNEFLDDYHRWYASQPEEVRKSTWLAIENSITELILACDVEVSCERCTTALESWIAGKPTVELGLEKHPVFYDAMTAALNVECDDPASLVPTIEAQLAAPVPERLAADRLDHLREWCDAPDGTSSERMARTIADMIRSKRETDWGRLTVKDHRRGVKLRLLRSLGLPYTYDPFLFIKKHVKKSKYTLKEYNYQKTIKPADVEKAYALLERLSRSS